MNKRTQTTHGDADLAPRVANFYARAPRAVQAELLSALLKPLGTLAFVAVAAGSFARFWPARRDDTIDIAPDTLGDISPDQIQELARYADQVEPQLLAELPQRVGAAAAWADAQHAGFASARKAPSPNINT